MERSEQNQACTWAIEDLFPSDEAWQSAHEEAKKILPRIRALEGRLGESGETLLSSMALEDEMSVALMDLIEYAARKGDEDTRVAKYQDMMAQLTSLLVEINTASSYEDNEILAISDEALEQFYAQTPALALYRRKLEQVRRRSAHILSPAEETLLASAGELSEGPDTIFSMLNDADMTFPDAVDSEGNTHAVTHGSYIPSCTVRIGRCGSPPLRGFTPSTASSETPALPSSRPRPSSCCSSPGRESTPPLWPPHWTRTRCRRLSITT